MPNFPLPPPAVKIILHHAQSSSSNKSKAHKPASNHSWKQELTKYHLILVEENDRKLIKSLYDSTRAWR